MESLPLEIVQQILSHVPKQHLPTTRLVCHIFDTIAFPLLFYHVPQWLDYENSHQAVLSLAHDIYGRPAVMWSPWASGPDGPVEDIWMGIVWRLLMKSPPPGLLSSSKKAGAREQGERTIVLTAENFVILSEWRKCQRIG